MAKGEAKPESKGPATTMASGNPTAPKSGPTMNHYETWKSLKDAGKRIEAAAYRQQHALKIDEQAPK